MNLRILVPIARISSCRVMGFAAVDPGSMGIAGVGADGYEFRWPSRSAHFSRPFYRTALSPSLSRRGE